MEVTTLTNRMSIVVLISSMLAWTAAIGAGFILTDAFGVLTHKLAGARPWQVERDAVAVAAASAAAAMAAEAAASTGSGKLAAADAAAAASPPLARSTLPPAEPAAASPPPPTTTTKTTPPLDAPPGLILDGAVILDARARTSMPPAPQLRVAERAAELPRGASLAPYASPAAAAALRRTSTKLRIGPPALPSTESFV
jgi:hypothetical protein